jgi:site-specific DNA recombinase
MKNRQLSFGYAVLQGQIVTIPSEAEAVRFIFDAYLQGASYTTITRMMSQKNLPYHEGKSVWNKNMVKRVLENKRYLGTDRYPFIISSAIFAEAERIKAGKCLGAKKEPVCVKTVRKSAICGVCGRPLHRNTKRHGVERWYCETEGCNLSPGITDTILVDQVVSLLSYVGQNPWEIEVLSVENKCHDLEITRLNNEINRELDKPDCNEEHAKALIMACAAAQYRLCADSLLTQRAVDFRATFQQHDPVNDFDREFFQDAIDHVIVQPDGSVSLKLKNGQIFENTEERGNPTCRQQNA